MAYSSQEIISGGPITRTAPRYFTGCMAPDREIIRNHITTILEIPCAVHWHNRARHFNYLVDHTAPRQTSIIGHLHRNYKRKRALAAEIWRYQRRQSHDRDRQIGLHRSNRSL